MSQAESGATSGRQFHLRQLVGKGAFGEVYLAEQDSGAGFRRKVAIKLLHTDVAAMSRDAGRRMRDEARILGRLSHRNIVTVLDLVKLGDRWAIIMDYVPGADLEETLHALAAAGERFPGAAAVEVGASVLDALDAAFRSTDDDGGQLGVIHRDIKPSNIRLTTDGEVKVLDFGVARVNLDTREAQTRATGWIGTERYMAPERILCEGDGPAGDVYAATASVVELLLGEPLGRTPVLEERHTPWIEAALERARPSVRGQEAVVDEVIDWLRRGLHAVPEQRPGAREMSDALTRLARQLEGEGVVAFARAFMPRVDELLQRSPEAAKGTLAEHSSGSGVNVPTNPTVLPGPDSGATFVASDPAPTQDRSVRVAAFLGIALLAVFVSGTVGLGLAWVAYSRSTAADEPVAAVAVPDPVPAAAPAPAPATVEPADPPAPVEPAPTATEPAPGPRPTPTPAPVVAPAPAPTGPRIDRAMVLLKDASSVSVTCGDVQATGTASTRISNFPAGPCAISAVYLNQTFTASANIDRPREVRCSVTGGTLTCE